VPNSYECREDYIISEYADPWIQQYSADICRLALDLAYLPKSIAAEIAFNEESIFKLITNLRRKYVEEEDKDHHDSSQGQLIGVKY